MSAQAESAQRRAQASQQELGESGQENRSEASEVAFGAGLIAGHTNATEAEARLHVAARHFVRKSGETRVGRIEKGPTPVFMKLAEGGGQREAESSPTSSRSAPNAWDLRDGNRLSPRTVIMPGIIGSAGVTSPVRSMKNIQNSLAHLRSPSMSPSHANSPTTRPVRDVKTPSAGVGTVKSFNSIFQSSPKRLEYAVGIEKHSSKHRVTFSPKSANDRASIGKSPVRNRKSVGGARSFVDVQRALSPRKSSEQSIQNMSLTPRRKADRWTNSFDRLSSPNLKNSNSSRSATTGANDNKREPQEQESEASSTITSAVTLTAIMPTAATTTTTTTTTTTSMTSTMSISSATMTAATTTGTTTTAATTTDTTTTTRSTPTLIINEFSDEFWKIKDGKFERNDERFPPLQAAVWSPPVDISAIEPKALQEEHDDVTIVEDDSILILAGVISGLPLSVLAYLLPFLDSETTFVVLLSSLALAYQSDRFGRPAKSALPHFATLQFRQEALSQLQRSGALECYWRFSIQEHRRVRMEAIDRGDLRFDVESSWFPPVMGALDQDVPPWKRDFDDEDLERITKSDDALFQQHQAMLQDLFAYFSAGEGCEELVLPPLVCMRTFGAGTSIDALLTGLRGVDTLTTLNLSGCIHVGREALLMALPTLPQLQRLELAGVPSVDDEVCRVIGELPELTFLDLSLCREGLTDNGLLLLCEGVKKHQKLRMLSLTNASQLTDQGLRSLNKLGVSKMLEDVCLMGCHKITDGGLLALASRSLRRINYCGCYKVTEGMLRYLIAQNRSILIYNDGDDFGISSETQSRLLGGASI